MTHRLSSDQFPPAHPALSDKSWGDLTESVPVEFFDDVQGNMGTGGEAANPAGVVDRQDRVDKIAGTIAEGGIQEALMLEYHPETGVVWLGEGNHRLAAARQLGLDTVPVRGMRRDTTPLPGRLSGKKLAPHTLEHLDNEEYYGHAWVNKSGKRLESSFSPSDIGISVTARGTRG
jgi:hypothetical protein